MHAEETSRLYLLANAMKLNHRRHILHAECDTYTLDGYIKNNPRRFISSLKHVHTKCIFGSIDSDAATKVQPRHRGCYIFKVLHQFLWAHHRWPVVAPRFWIWSELLMHAGALCVFKHITPVSYWIQPKSSGSKCRHLMKLTLACLRHSLL